MFRVTKTAKTPNMVWDSSENRSLCKFVKGVFETNDEAVASRLEGMGYKVEKEADADADADVKPLDEMKVEELKTYAAEHGIDLKDSKGKADILKTIQEAESNQ